MGTLALPPPEDVIICRRSAESFTISMTDRTPQIRCRTFEEALQRAATFATHQRAHVWLATDGREYVRVASDRLLRRVWNEYVEMPGLRLTRAPAQRLWSVDENTCGQLLDSLVQAKLLVCDADGRHGRAADKASPEPAAVRTVKVNIPIRPAQLQRSG